MNWGDKPLRDLGLFPVIYNAVGIVVIGMFYASSPGFSVDWNALNFVLYFLVFTTHWLLAFVVIRRLRKEGISLSDFIRSKKKTSVLPALTVFVSLNLVFDTYFVLALAYGRIPPYGKAGLLELAFYLLLSPLTAGFVEELIWRGYFIQKLEDAGYAGWKGIALSAISFALIHGFFVVDKLLVTFVWGIIAGIYYVKERNLPVLMITHVMVDMITFGLGIFA